MKDLQILTAIFVFIWTSLSTTFNAYKQINSVRDSIIMGKINGDLMTESHRELLYESDWKPLMFGIMFRSMIFCVLIGFLPVFAEQRKNSVIIITIIAILIPLMIFIGSIKHYQKEKKVIESVLKTKVEQVEKP